MAQASLESDLILDQFQLCFEKNLTFFKKRNPALYELAMTYRPETNLLGVGDAGHAILYDASTDQQLTSNNPAQEVQTYLANYRGDPECITYGAKDISSVRIWSVSCVTPSLENLLKCVPKGVGPCTIDGSTHIPLAICFGQGLGHIIEQLPNLYTIQHLVIYEPNLDNLYASFFVQDYEALSDPFSENYKSITFAIGDAPEMFCNGLGEFVKQKGHFLLAGVLLLEPYPTPLTTRAKNMFSATAHRMRRGWGFFADELQGLKQTLSNCDTALNLLSPVMHQKSHLANIPCCVVGNGASLDESIDFLRDHQDKVLIISAGTTIHTLLTHGIRPDIHVEIERMQGTYHHLALLSESGQLTGIPLVTLNTTVPRARKLFERSYVFLKNDDLGSDVLEERGITAVGKLKFTHPLSGNGAAAVAAGLGCTQILFLGMDLSISADGYVHSRNSIYNGADAKLAEPNRDYNCMAHANISGIVYTNEQYDSARLCLELLIQAHQGKQFYNVGNGIRVAGAKPIAQASAMVLKNTLNKDSLIERALRSSQVLKLDEAARDDVLSQTARDTSELIHKLKHQLWDKKSHNTRAAVACFSEQILALQRSNQSSCVPSRLLSGSMAYLHAQVLYSLIFIKNRAAQEKFIRKARGIIIRYLDRIDGQLKGVMKEAHGK